MHKFNGIVVTGQKRGKKLGFPTANIPLSSPIPEGIYISFVLINGKVLQALTFIGAAETFDEKDVKSETWIFNFNEDIYGKDLEVELLVKIRENKKFSSVEELVGQMEKDKKTALAYFDSYRSKK